MYYIGLDLGKAADFTAIQIVEKLVIKLQDTDEYGKPRYEEQYHVRHIQRYPLNTQYVEIVNSVQKLMLTKQLINQSLLIVDATGVGAPVVEMIRGREIDCIPVVITGGQNELFDEEGGNWHIPKKVLVSNLLLLFGQKRLKFADGLPEKKVTIDELTNFKMKITAHGSETYEAWREGDHDDLVLALAIAAWYAERFGIPIAKKKTNIVKEHPLMRVRSKLL